jgi:hypothetical protein
MNKTGKIDLGYKPKYTFDEAFGNNGHILKQTQSEIEKLKQLTKENELLKLYLIIVVTVLLILCLRLTYKWVTVMRRNNKDL